MIFEIDDIAKVGSVRDVPGYQLPPEVWTLALNVRYADEALEALDGWAQVFGTPLYAPHFALPVATTGTMYWVYVSLTKAAVFDGVTHTDITRLAGNYTATDTFQWNGTLFGNIPILNNGNDKPQYWAPPLSVATKLADLPNWPATTRAKVIRSFGSFLVAANTIEAGIEFPHRVLWSHPADPGAVPPSWNVSDPTVDAGNIDLPDVSAGLIVDMLPLSSTMYVYKEASIWKMRFVGGQSIFDFGQSSWITTAGLLGPRCVCITGDGTKHILATQDDIIWHNGSQVQSILNRRQRKRLQGELDPTTFAQSFIFPNPFNNEVWFCYPNAGSAYPNRVLILNYKTAGGNDFVVTEGDGITFRNAAVGTIESFDPEIWDTGTDTWDVPTGPWSQLERRRVVLLDPSASKFYVLGGGVMTRDGVSYDSTLQREGLALIGKKQSGEAIVDFQVTKMLTRMWPKLIGGPMGIRFGAQQTVNGSTAWGSQVTFNPEVDMYVDPGIASGRAVGIELTANGRVWRLDGYKIEMTPLGEF